MKNLNSPKAYSLERNRSGRLLSIISELAIGEGDIRERLGAINIKYLLDTQKDLPSDLQEEWKSIMHSLMEKGPLKDIDDGTNLLGSIRNTVWGMRRKRAAKIAKRIVKIYYEAEFRL